MELVLRGDAAYEDRQVSDNLARVKAAQTLYDAALQLDPNFVPALKAKASIWDDINDFDPHIDRERVVRQMDELSLRAVTLDPTKPSSWSARFIALSDSGHWTAALEAINKLISYDPFSSDAYGQKAWAMNMLGRPVEALQLADKALTLNPEFT
jgi:tetratricopeptide (TPR) repeat protein